MTQEERSIKFVLKFEKSQRRKPIDKSKQHVGYDVRSGNRFIEVKSRPGPKIQPHISLSPTLLRAMGGGISHYYLYIVYDMKKSPKLTIVPPKTIFRNLEAEVKLLLRGKAYNKIRPIKLS